MDETDNTYQIACHIFSCPPKPPKTIELMLEEQTSFLAIEYDATKFINEVLFVITLHGVEILFGHRNIKELTEKQIDLIYQYVNSYGYTIKTHDNKISFVKI